MKNANTLIETLESRIAPAAVFTFTDVDGDLCKIVTSKGSNEALAAVITKVASGSGVIVTEVDLSKDAATFSGTSFTASVVKRAAAGDGLVNLGYIDAATSNGSMGSDGTALNLGAVKIQGDLGQIDAGTGLGRAVASLKTASLGVMGGVTQGANKEAFSTLAGDVGSIALGGDVSGVGLYFHQAGSVVIGGNVGSSSIGASAGIGLLKIGGVLNSSNVAAQQYGSVIVNEIGTFSKLDATGGIGKLVAAKFTDGKVTAASAKTVKIRSTLAGVLDVDVLHTLTVAGDLTGRVEASAAGRITVLGSVVGQAVESGRIAVALDAGSIFIKGDVKGGPNVNNGYLTVGGSVASVRIGGNLQAAPVAEADQFSFNCDRNGALEVGGDLRVLQIGGNLQGTSVFTTAPQYDHKTNGAVIVQGNLNQATIGGSIIAGFTLTGNNLKSSGTIEVGKNIGKLTVKGNIQAGAGHTAVITALGADVAGSKTAAIGSLTVKGNISDATIRAGVAGDSIVNQQDSRDESIGTVTVLGNFAESTILAGAKGFVNDATIFSRIARITVGGTATGGNANTSYGFIAEEIAALKVAGRMITLQAGKLNDKSIALDPMGNTILAEKLL
jgi:hypothetical protein